MNKYLITEEHLGDTASKEEAMKMIALLQTRGFDVEYGDPVARLRPRDWNWSEEEDFNIAFIEEMQNL